MSPREGSAIEEFFGDFVPLLDSAFRNNNRILADDPTIDLDHMEVARCSPGLLHQQQQKRQQQPQQQQHHQHHQQQQQQQQPKQQAPVQRNKTKGIVNRTFKLTEKRDLSMDELGVIVGQLKSESPYSEKLLGIMLNGLEKTLSPNYYRFFVQYGLPDNWFPIVKMNNDNTPFVEFLIKSDLSDQDPFSQLKEYSTEHMALCKYVLNHLQVSASRQNQLMPGGHNQNIHHQQQQQQQHQQQQQQQHQPRQIKSSKCAQNLSQQQQRQQVLVDKNHRCSLPTPMTCSTPIAQRQASVAKRGPTITQRLSVDAVLNDSKRVLPPRACKSSSTTGTYKKYLNFSITNERK